MSTPAKLGATVATIAVSGLLFATLHAGWIDAVDGGVLIAAIALLARIMFRLASEPVAVRRRSH